MNEGRRTTDPVSHTPGPWSVGHVRPTRVHPSLGPHWEAPIHCGPRENPGNCHTVVYGGGPGVMSSTQEAVIANARLIAAAPELLALAEQYLSECSECNGSGTTWDRNDVRNTVDCPDCADIRAVIAKAKGGSDV